MAGSIKSGSGYALTGTGGGGGVTDHTALTSLSWTICGHTGTAGSIALFDSLGATDLLTGVVQGDVVFYNGTTWTRLVPGAVGEFLQTQGAGADPVWAAGGGGAATLQTAYDGGNTILSSAAEGGPVAITTTAGEADSGLTVTAGNHLLGVAQDLVVLTGDAQQTGDVESIVNPGTGSAVSIAASGAASAVPQVLVDFGSTTYTSGTAGPDGIRIDYGTADLSATAFPVGFTLDMAAVTIGAGSTFSYGMWLRGATGTGSTETYGLAIGGLGSAFDIALVINDSSGVWLPDSVPILFGSRGATAKTAGDLELVYDPVGSKGFGVYLREVAALAAGDGNGSGLIVEAQPGGAASGATNGGVGGVVNIGPGDGGDAGTGTGNAGVGGSCIVLGGTGGDADATGPEDAARGGTINLTSGAGGAGAGAGLAGAGGAYTARAGNGGAGTATVTGGTGGAISVNAGSGGLDGGAGVGAEGAVTVGTAFASAVTVGGAQTGAVKAETASGNNSSILALTALGVAGEAFAMFAGTGDPQGATSADTGSTFQRDTGTGGGAYLNTSTGGSGTDWSRIVVQLTVDAKTVAYAINAFNDQGRTFTNEGAAAIVVFTLPTAVAGQSYTFIVQDADLLRVVAAAGDTIRLGSSVSAAAGNVESTAIGDVVELIAINATEWIARSVIGTWTVT